MFSRKGRSSLRRWRGKEQSHLLDPSFSDAAKTISLHLLIVCSRPGLKHTVASLSEDVLAQCRTQCSAQSLPYVSVPQQLALSPLRLEWCQIPPVSHVFAWLKQKEQSWYLDKAQTGKNIFGSLWVITTNPCEPGQRFSHVDKLFWKSH